MTTRDTETLADLINAKAGKRSGSPMSFEDLSKISVDERSGYRPSGSMLWKIAHHQGIKVNPDLVRAVAAGLGLPLDRVEAAAHRQYISGYAAVDPGLGGGGDDDEVIRAARRVGSTPGDDGGVEEFVRKSREDDAPEQR
jgi:hypothetical protein